MCIKSHRHLCLQILLLILLLACLIIFVSAIFANLGFYLLTSSAAILQDDVAVQSAAVSVYASPVAGSAQTMALIDPSTNMRVEPPQAQVSEVDEIELPLADWLMEKATSYKCSWFNSTVQSGQLLQLCDDMTDPFTSRRAFARCFRTTTLYEGLALLLPALLIFLSTIAICRLLLCPMLTLAIVYILLSIALVVGAILFNEGVIISNLHTEDALPALFHVLLALVILYTVLALLHILLFALVSCEQRRLRQNGDAEKIMKQSTDDEDDIDDPKAPLYENGFSPQKKNDFEEKIKEFKYIDDDMSYIFRKG